MCEVTESTLSRWMRGKGETAANSVIDFAHHMKTSPIEALIAAGYLREEDVAGVIEVVARVEWTDAELLAELAAHLAQRPLTPESDDITPRMALPADHFAQDGKDGQRVG
jgi:hypothetical protein